MKDVTLNDLKRLVETLDNDAPIPKLETPQVFDEEIVEAAKEAKNNMFKTLLQEIEENESKISALEEEKKTLVEESSNYLPDLKEQQADPLLAEKVSTLEGLQKQQKLLITRLQNQLGSLGGGGEVRLEFLDDVDRDSAKVDGRFLKYQSSTGTFIGAAAGGSYSGTAGQLLQHDGSDYVGVSSVGVATFFNDHHQGYYRYSTNYYTAGVANTVQTLPANEFVLVQPSVRTNKTDFMPQKMLDANSGVPWIGAGATIGTGQTEFSLAGLDDGSTVVVRIASQFNPDIDNTNLDFRLNFTTNPTTQAAGTTNFSITREQALICNEGADQDYICETLMNFYVGSSLSGIGTTSAGTFNISARASDEGDFEMMALTINVVA